MAKLFTVESYATPQFVKVYGEEGGYYICLNEECTNPEANSCIFLDTTNTPQTSIECLGMTKFLAIKEGVFDKISSKKFILKKSKSKDKGKIIFSSYKHFNVIKGEAHYIMEPLPRHDYVLISISANCILELSDKKGSTKIISCRKLT